MTLNQLLSQLLPIETQNISLFENKQLREKMFLFWMEM